MSSTLLRLGLWTLIIVLGLYVVSETYPESIIAELIPASTLQKALALGVLLIAAGLGLRMFGVASRVVAKNRCARCNTVIPKGAIYCRAHLRKVLHEEDDRAHHTQTRA